MSVSPFAADWGDEVSGAELSGGQSHVWGVVPGRAEVLCGRNAGPVPGVCESTTCCMVPAAASSTDEPSSPRPWMALCPPAGRAFGLMLWQLIPRLAVSTRQTLIAEFAATTSRTCPTTHCECLAAVAADPAPFMECKVEQKYRIIDIMRIQ